MRSASQVRGRPSQNRSIERRLRSDDVLGDSAARPDAAAIKGAIDFTTAGIGDLVVDEGMQGKPRLPGTSLAAAGWRLRDVHGALLTDWKVAEQWRDSRPPKLGF